MERSGSRTVTLLTCSGRRDKITLRQICFGLRAYAMFFQLPAIVIILVAIRRRYPLMNPYAKPKERNIGARRPRIRHVSHSVEPRTRRERQAEKQGVAAERRAIKKAARRHLKEQLQRELNERI